jgi:Sec-independent protein translocase protein TatA
MEIFGIGPLEFVLIVVIMLIVLGPKEMVVTAGKIGRFVRQIIRSPMWGTIMQTSKDVRDLPTKIIREAGLEEDIAQIKEVARTPGQMMNDAAKQLKVEIDPIDIPKIQNPLTSALAGSATASAAVAAPANAIPASSSQPAPLVIEPEDHPASEFTPETSLLNSQETPAPMQVGFNEEPPLPLPEDIEPPQLMVQPPDFPDNHVLENPARPLIVEDYIPSSQSVPEPKRKTRRAKSDQASQDTQAAPAETGSQTTPQASPLPADVPDESLQPVRKPRRTKAKPTPLESEPMVVIETSAPHDNGASASSG